MTAPVPIENTWSIHNVASASTGPFAFTFKYFEKADLTVLVDDVPLANTAWSVVPGTADTHSGYIGGSVTLNTAVSNAKVTVAREMDAQRESNLVGAQLTANALNYRLNEHTMLIQDLQRDNLRAFRTDYGQTWSVVSADDLAKLSAIDVEITQVADIDTELLVVAGLSTQIQWIYANRDSLPSGGSGGATVNQNGFGKPLADYGTGHAAIVAAEADSSVTHVNLGGLTVTTTLTEQALTKNYFGGTLYAANVNGNLSVVRRQSPILAQEIQRRWTKSPLRKWKGTKGIWHGTSIPHQLVGNNSYPALVGLALDATVSNWAWSGSHVTFDPAADPNVSGSVRALTMTDADLAAELAEHGSGSVYSDTHDAITISSEMTLEHRVVEPIIASPVDWVVCDHNHNDRYADKGTLTETSYSITAVSKGANTLVTVSDATGLAVGDGVIIKEIVGIDYLRYFAGRVTNVSSNTITLAVDSSGFNGTFSSGTLIKVDRATLWGAMDFYAHAVWNATLRGGRTTLPPIIWNSAPSEYTNDTTGADGNNPADQSILSNSDYIYEWVVARNQQTEDDQRGVPYHTFYDQLYDLAINEHDHQVWLPDNVHPTDEDATRMFANHWTRWMLGGAPRHYDESELLLTGEAPADIDQYPVIFSAFYNGFGRPEWAEGAAASVKAEDFASIADWSSNTGSAVVGAAPYGGANALNVTMTNGNTPQFLTLLQADFDDATAMSPYVSAEFDLYVPTVTGAVASGVATIPILSIDTGATAHFQVQLVARSTGMTIRGAALPSTSGAFSYTVAGDIKAATKHRVKLLAVKGDGANYDGGIVLYLDGEIVGGPVRFDNSSRADATQIRLGGISANATSTFSFSIGDLAINDKALSPWTKSIGQIGGTIDASSVSLGDLGNVNDSGGQDGWALRKQADGSWAPEADPDSGGGGGGSSFDGTLTNVNLQVINSDSLSGFAPISYIRRRRSDYASQQTVNLGMLVWTGYDSAGNEDTAVSIKAQWISNVSGSESGRLTLFSRQSGVEAEQASLQNGFRVGNSGTFHGLGTINVTAGYYLNGQQLKSTHLADFSNATPSVGQVPKWNGSQWVPSTDNTGGSSGTSNPQQSAISNPNISVTDASSGNSTNIFVQMSALSYEDTRTRINDNFATVANRLNVTDAKIEEILAALRGANIIAG